VFFWYSISAAVGVPADASAVVGIPNVAGISAVAGLPSAVYVLDAYYPCCELTAHPTIARSRCDILLVLLLISMMYLLSLPLRTSLILMVSLL
jgi:hypothetical protein